ncbi:cortistatin-like [Ochotona curzoniae]|uniref:cortistatin-like n=1 Tax=Ochotona curzoniae TaxID=130825 RepID=UPI001B34F38A|nr:cortistatin-like [Ochotona curzoniae]
MPTANLPLLLLLLLLSGAAATAMATATLAQESGTAGKESGEGMETQPSGPQTFLARWYEWTSQARGGTDAGAVSQRRTRPPVPPPRPAPCRTFFWKTFSSCK